MTTATTGPTGRAGTSRALTFPRIVRSEWLKLKTLRSTWITLFAAVVILVLAAGLIANHVHDDLVRGAQFQDPEDRDLLTVPLRGFGVAQLVMGVLGVLSITGEYATGTIRASFTAVPTRLPVLGAKVLVFALLGFTTMLAGVLAAFFLGQGLLGAYGLSLGHQHALRVVIALAGYLTLVGLLGLGLGTLVRSTAGGIASLVGLLLVAPGILAALGTSWSTSVSHYLPLNAGQAMFSDLTPTNGDLGPTGGLLTMLAWVAAGLIGSAVVVSRRDA